MILGVMRRYDRHDVEPTIVARVRSSSGSPKRLSIRWSIHFGSEMHVFSNTHAAGSASGLVSDVVTGKRGLLYNLVATCLVSVAQENND